MQEIKLLLSFFARNQILCSVLRQNTWACEIPRCHVISATED